MRHCSLRAQLLDTQGYLRAWETEKYHEYPRLSGSGACCRLGWLNTSRLRPTVQAGVDGRPGRSPRSATEQAGPAGPERTGAERESSTSRVCDIAYLPARVLFLHSVLGDVVCLCLSLNRLANYPSRIWKEKYDPQNAKK